MERIRSWFKELTRTNRIIVATLAVLVALLIGSSFSTQTTEYQFPAAQAIEDTVPSVGKIYVHVAGEVMSPGLYQLTPGQRVEDAIALAGGFTEHAFEQSINLARMLSDGEQIVVLAFGQIASGGNSGFISLNNASQEQLESLPGVGPSLAKSILEYRTAIGSFSDVEQLREVSGIGPKLFAKISPQLSL
jgi:competence protein ComEA